MKYKGRLTTPEQFEDIVAAAKPTGEVLRLGDVAEIELGRVTYGFSNSLNGYASTGCHRASRQQAPTRLRSSTTVSR